MPFVVAPGIDLTETVDLILLFRRQPPICLLLSLPQSRSFSLRFLYLVSVVDYFLIYDHSRRRYFEEVFLPAAKFSELLLSGWQCPVDGILLLLLL